MPEEPYHEWQGFLQDSQRFLHSFTHVIDDLTRQLREARTEIERLSKFAGHQAASLDQAQQRIRSLEIRFGTWEQQQEGE